MGAMVWKSVSSSNIAAVGYDQDNRTLRIRFHSGGVYEYANVAKATYHVLMRSDSIGGFFDREIKDKYPTKKIS